MGDVVWWVMGDVVWDCSILDREEEVEGGEDEEGCI